MSETRKRYLELSARIQRTLEQQWELECLERTLIAETHAMLERLLSKDTGRPCSVGDTD